MSCTTGESGSVSRQWKKMFLYSTATGRLKNTPRLLFNRYWGLSPMVKRPVREAGNSTSITVAYIASTLHAITSWCLIKHISLRNFPFSLSVVLNGRDPARRQFSARGMVAFPVSITVCHVIEKMWTRLAISRRGYRKYGVNFVKSLGGLC
jgi:hypothetical protein